MNKEMQIQKSKVDQIISLHDELEGLLNKSLGNMIQLGEILTGIKAELPHGQFSTWITDNLPFTDRTARNYMKVYKRRAELGEAGNITEAYKLLSETKTETVSVFPEVESDLSHLEKLMYSLGVKSIIPAAAETVILFATKTLDPYMDKQGDPFATMELKRLNEDYLNVRIKRLAGDFGYELKDRRGGVRISDIDFLVIAYQNHFAFNEVVHIEVKAAA